MKFCIVMVNYNMYAFNRKSINIIHTTIYIIYQSILINNVNHDTKQCLFWHTLNCLRKSKYKNKQTSKQRNKQRNKTIVDDDCLIMILDNILYTNLSLVLNNLQQIKQDMNAIFQWVAHLALEQRNQIHVIAMGT